MFICPPTMPHRVAPSGSRTINRNIFVNPQSIDAGHNVFVNDHGFSGEIGPGYIEQFKKPNPAFVDVPYDENRPKSFYNSIKVYESQPGNTTESIERVIATYEDKLNEYEDEQKRQSLSTTQAEPQNLIEFPEPAEERPFYIQAAPSDVAQTTTPTDQVQPVEGLKKIANRMANRNINLGVYANWSSTRKFDESFLNPFMITKDMDLATQTLVATSQTANPALIKYLDFGKTKEQIEMAETGEQTPNIHNEIIKMKTLNPTAVPITKDDVKHDNYDPVTGTFKQFQKIFANNNLALSNRDLVSVNFGNFHFQAPQGVALLLTTLKTDLRNMMEAFKYGQDPSQYMNSIQTNIASARSIASSIPQELRSYLDEMTININNNDRVEMRETLNKIFKYIPDRDEEPMDFMYDPIKRPVFEDDDEYMEDPWDMDYDGSGVTKSKKKREVANPGKSDEDKGSGLTGGGDEDGDMTMETVENAKTAFQTAIDNIENYAQHIIESRQEMPGWCSELLTRLVQQCKNTSVLRPESGLRNIHSIVSKIARKEWTSTHPEMAEIVKNLQGKVQKIRDVVYKRETVSENSLKRKANMADEELPQKVMSVPLEEEDSEQQQEEPIVLGQEPTPIPAPPTNTSQATPPNSETAPADYPPVNLPQTTKVNLTKPPSMSNEDFEHTLNEADRMANGEEMTQAGRHNVMTVLQHTFETTNDPALKESINDVITQFGLSRNFVVPAVPEVDQADPSAADGILEVYKPPQEEYDTRVAQVMDTDGTIETTASPSGESVPTAGLTTAQHDAVERAQQVFNSINNNTKQTLEHAENFAKDMDKKLNDLSSQLSENASVADTQHRAFVKKVIDTTQETLMTSESIDESVRDLVNNHNALSHTLGRLVIEVKETTVANQHALAEMESHMSGQDRMINLMGNGLAEIKQAIDALMNGNFSNQQALGAAHSALEGLAGNDMMVAEAMNKLDERIRTCNDDNKEAVKNVMESAMKEIASLDQRYKDQQNTLNQAISEMMKEGTRITAEKYDEQMDKIRNEVANKDTGLSRKVKESEHAVMRQLHKMDTHQKMKELTDNITKTQEMMTGMKKDIGKHVSKIVADAIEKYNGHVDDMAKGKTTIKKEAEKMDVHEGDSIGTLAQKLDDLVSKNSVPKQNKATTDVFKKENWEHVSNGDDIVRRIVHQAARHVSPEEMIWNNRNRSRGVRASIFHRFQTENIMRKPTEDEMRKIFKERNSKVSKDKVTASQTMLLGRKPITHIKKNKNYHKLSPMQSTIATLGQRHINKYLLWSQGVIPFMSTGYVLEPVRLTRTKLYGLPDTTTSRRGVTLLV